MNSKCALLVIDLQNAYLPGNKWACKKIVSAIKNTEDIIKKFSDNQVFFTKFIATNEPEGVWKDYNEEYADINANEYLNEYVEEIKKYITKDNSFIKSKYSCMSNIELKRKINEFDVIYITGVVADCCVLSTVYELIDMGKKVVFCKDAIAGQNEIKENAVIEVLKGMSPLHIIFE